MPSKFFPIFVLMMLALTACVTPTQGTTDRRIYEPGAGKIFIPPGDVTETPTESVAAVARDGYEASVTFTFYWTMRNNKIRTESCEAFVKGTGTNMGIDGLPKCYVRYMHNDIFIEIDLTDGNTATFNVSSSGFHCEGYQPIIRRSGGWTYQNAPGGRNANRVACSSSGFAD